MASRPAEGCWPRTDPTDHIPHTLATGLTAGSALRACADDLAAADRLLRLADKVEDARRRLEEAITKTADAAGWVTFDMDDDDVVDLSRSLDAAVREIEGVSDLLLAIDDAIRKAALVTKEAL